MGTCKHRQLQWHMAFATKKIMYKILWETTGPVDLYSPPHHFCTGDQPHSHILQMMLIKTQCGRSEMVMFHGRILSRRQLSHILVSHCCFGSSVQALSAWSYCCFSRSYIFLATLSLSVLFLSPAWAHPPTCRDLSSVLDLPICLSLSLLST